MQFESRLDYERFQRLLEEATQQETPQTQRVTSLTQSHADSLLDRLAAKLGLDGDAASESSNATAVSKNSSAAPRKAAAVPAAVQAGQCTPPRRNIDEDTLAMNDTVKVNKTRTRLAEVQPAEVELQPTDIEHDAQATDLSKVRARS